MEKFNQRRSPVWIAGLGLFVLLSLPQQTQAMDPDPEQEMELKLDDAGRPVPNPSAVAASPFEKTNLKSILKSLLAYLQPSSLIQGIQGDSQARYWINPEQKGVDQLMNIHQSEEKSDVTRLGFRERNPQPPYRQAAEVAKLKRHLENTLGCMAPFFPKIESLDFHDVSLPQSFFTFLLEVKNLKTLSLSSIHLQSIDTNFLQDTHGNSFQKMDTVTELSIRNCVVGKTQLSQLLRCFNRIQSLDLRGSTTPTSSSEETLSIDGEGAFPNLPALERIHSDWNPFFPCFGQMDLLESLGVEAFFDHAKEKFDFQKFQEFLKAAALYPHLLETSITEQFTYPPDLLDADPIRLQTNSNFPIDDPIVANKAEQMLAPFADRHLWAKKLKQMTFLAQGKYDALLEAAVHSAEETGNLDLVDFTGRMLITLAGASAQGYPPPYWNKKEVRDLLEALFQFVDQGGIQHQNDRLRIKKRLGIDSIFLLAFEFASYEKTKTGQKVWLKKMIQHLSSLSEEDPLSANETRAILKVLETMLAKEDQPLISNPNALLHR